MDIKSPKRLKLFFTDPRIDGNFVFAMKNMSTCFKKLWRKYLNRENDFPKDSNDWKPPKGWIETSAGQHTGGRIRHWKKAGDKYPRREWHRGNPDDPRPSQRVDHWHKRDANTGRKINVDGDTHIKPNRE
ncbi:MAG: hypothetical protein ACE5PV_23700 [Candidatus Poribacteria bacterium]